MITALNEAEFRAPMAKFAFACGVVTKHMGELLLYGERNTAVYDSAGTWNVPR